MFGAKFEKGHVTLTTLIVG